MKNRIPFIISALLILVALAAGIWMLVTGIGSTLEENALKAEYASTEGQLSDYTLASPGGYDSVRRRHTSATYTLTYTYFVDDMPYTVSTDYSTGNVPALGSARTIYYDPANPENAIPGGVSGSSVLLFGGFMFTAIPMIFILVGCSAMGWLPKTRIEWMDVIIGGITAGLGGGFAALMEGPFHILMLIPWLLVGAGVWLMIRGLFLSGKKEKRK